MHTDAAGHDAATCGQGKNAISILNAQFNHFVLLWPKPQVSAHDDNAPELPPSPTNIGDANIPEIPARLRTIPPPRHNHLVQCLCEGTCGITHKQITQDQETCRDELSTRFPSIYLQFVNSRPLSKPLRNLFIGDSSLLGTYEQLRIPHYQQQEQPQHTHPCR